MTRVRTRTDPQKRTKVVCRDCRANPTRNARIEMITRA